MKAIATIKDENVTVTISKNAPAWIVKKFFDYSKSKKEMRASIK